MKRLLLFAVAFLVLAGSVQAQTLNVRLRISNVNSSVYVPGFGEMPFGSLGPERTYTNPDHFYIASYLNNAMYALAGATGASLSTSSDASTHTIGISQDLQGSKILLGFTSGDWNNVDAIISSLEDGTFLQEIAPSFSFGIGALYPIKVLLEYQDINITGNFGIHSGFRKITVSNEGFWNGKPKVKIEST
jgi:hypothetical protein